MAITIEQLKDLGFKPFKKESPFKKKYDTLILSLNKTDYLYLGYNEYAKSVNNKLIWKSFLQPETKERISYVVNRIGEIGYSDMKDFITRALINANYKPSESEQEYLNGRDN